MAELEAFAAWVVRALFRFFVTGQAIDGRPRDNATFLQPANVDHRGNPTEKLSAARWKRVARRWAVAGFPLCLMSMSVIARAWQEVAAVDPPWVFVEWRDMAFRWWIVLTLGLSAFYGWQGVQFLRHSKVTNEFVYPTWEAACDAMGYKFRTAEARRMVSLPDDFEPPDNVEKPHGWATARFHRWRVRRLAARAITKAEPSEEPAEPSTELVPVSAGTELQPYKQPPWTRLLPRRGSHAAEEEEEPVRITLIPGKCSTTAEKNRFTQKVGPVLGMPDPKPAWVMRGRSPYVELRPNHPPPPTLTFEEILPRLADANALAGDPEALQYALDHPLIGLSYGNRTEVIDFVNDSPHVLISGPPGTGKTNLVKFILCQRMHLGSALVVLDFKQVSHRWARDLPGCRYASEIEDIHDLLMEVGEEVGRRKRNAIPPGATLETPLVRFGTLDVLVEESNALADQLRDHWTDIRRPGDPQRSPAVRALKDAVFLGREFAMHLFVVAQRASASVFGPDGGDVRESFQIRLMSQWTIQTWKMLAGGTPFIRCPKGPRGIWARVQDGGAAIHRVPKTSDRQAQDRALSGIPSPGQAMGDTVIIEQAPAVPAAPELVMLSKALGLLPGPKMELPALRQASHRPGFPEPLEKGPNGRTYRLADLTAWKQDLDARKGLETAWALAEPRREGWVYRFDAYDSETGAIVCGYVGQTKRGIFTREDEHREDKPWADLIVGSAVEVWHSDACTDTELDEAELNLIRELLPWFNYIGNEGNPNAVPKWTQIEQRQARNAAKGLPPWEPVDVYNERKAALT